MFQYIGEDDSKQPLINGCKYVKLSKEEREEYVINCLVAVMRDSDDLEFEYLDIEVEQ